MQHLNRLETQKETLNEKIPHVFLFMWDMYGLEYCQDITAVEKRNMMNALKGQQLERPIDLNSLLLRAKFNNQRNYEIYTMTVEQGIKEPDVVAWFESNPQGAVDLIRDRGRKLFGESRIDPVIK